MQSDDDQWICPSFNSYSQNKLADIADKVAGEPTGDFQLSLPSIAENDQQNVNHEDEEDDFEFALIVNDELEVAGEETIIGGKYQPVIFPIFNREEKIDTIKVPLKRLFIEEREEEEAPSSSSSSGDEIESIPPGTYCVWKPKVVEQSPSTCKKSKSTGFGSKRWKLRDLLRRSNSEGKDSFVFLTPKRKEEKRESIKNSPLGIYKAAKALLSSNKSMTTKGSPAEAAAAGASSSSPGRRMLYSPKGNSEMPKRKSYLPYRQDLVGFFTTVNSLGTNFSSLKMK